MKRLALPATLLVLALALSACRAEIDDASLPTPIPLLSAADFPTPAARVAQAQPAAPVQEATAAPTAAPTEEPAVEPTVEAPAEAAVEPTAEQPATEAAEPTEAPTEASAEPATVEPATVEPATVETPAEASPEPTAAPTEEPAAEQPAAQETVEPVETPTAAAGAAEPTESPAEEAAAPADEAAAEPAAAAETAEDPYAGLPEEVKAAMETADPSRGEALATQNACQACHSLQEGQVVVGPPWFDIGNSAATRVEGEGAALYLYNSIAHPNDFIVEGFQPNLMVQTFAETLTDQEMADLIAYLLSLKAEE